jgi:hypothetical protein
MQDFAQDKPSQQTKPNIYLTYKRRNQSSKNRK